MEYLAGFGVAGLILGGALFIYTIFLIVFPISVVMRLGVIAKTLKSIEKNMEQE